MPDSWRAARSRRSGSNPERDASGLPRRDLSWRKKGVSSSSSVKVQIVLVDIAMSSDAKQQTSDERGMHRPSKEFPPNHPMKKILDKYFDTAGQTLTGPAGSTLEQPHQFKPPPPPPAAEQLPYKLPPDVVLSKTTEEDEEESAGAGSDLGSGRKDVDEEERLTSAKAPENNKDEEPRRSNGMVTLSRCVKRIPHTCVQSEKTRDTCPSFAHTWSIFAESRITA